MISDEMRNAVIERAQGLCEYCYKPQTSFYLHEVDHIIARKHGGQTILANLALACFQCNRYKGSDIGSIDPLTSQLTPLFNPRQQDWRNHFRLQEGQIIPLSPEARVTTYLLRLNDPDRVKERIALRIETPQ